MRKTLCTDYEVFSAISQRSLQNILVNITPDLIAMKMGADIPHEFEMLELLRNNLLWRNIPVMVIMDEYSEKYVALALELEAAVCVSSHPSLIRHRISTLLAEIHYRETTRRLITDLELQVRRTKTQVFELQNAVFTGMAGMLESCDDLTGQHIERTRFYLEFLVEQLESEGVYTEEIASWDVDTLVASAVLHDIGKVAIPDAILLKPGRLDAEEFEVMKGHVNIGVRMIENMENYVSECPFLDYAKTIVATHHERWDGSGYPNGLCGEQIPLAGRLMAIADVYDAIISRRVYKEQQSPQFAQKVIEEGAGTHFDPVLVEAFKKIASRFASTALRFEDLERRASHPTIITALHGKGCSKREDVKLQSASMLTPVPVYA
jgi:putative two-component system response regulator